MIKKKEHYKLGFLGLLLGMSNAMIMQTLTSTALPTIAKEFNSSSYYSWIYTSYILASTVTIPLFGKFCDKYGYKRNYLIGGMVFLLGTLFSGLSNSMLQLVSARIITGIGSGIVIPATYAIISELFTKEKLTKVFAFLTLFQIINNGIGSFLGGILSQYFSWRIGFFILIPVELIAFICIFRGVSQDRKVTTTKSMNFISAISITLSLLFLMLGAEFMSKEISLKSLSLLFTGIIIFIIFIYRDNKSQNPIISKEMSTNKVIVRLLIQMILLGAIMNSCFAYLPFYLQTFLSYSPKQSSYLIIILIISIGLCGFLSGKTKNNYEGFLVKGWIFLALGIIFTILSSMSFNPFSKMLLFKSNIVEIVLGFIFIGIGIGVLMTLILGFLQQLLEDDKASGNGNMHLARNLGGAIGVALLQASISKSINILFLSLFISTLTGLYFSFKNLKH